MNNKNLNKNKFLVDNNYHPNTNNKYQSVQMTNKKLTTTTTNGDLADDGVRYKFVSNQTIGVKSSSHNEFDDLHDTSSNKMNKCTNCLKCCSVM